ncbi:PQQ-binding-like beta-propeller repeat protein [Aliikangiella sp. G2MR2-5]|uniref:outer membrane protein assembly factor BamB family protein n=1 Tax=Aliikangiella sp. G2MR2-5 TaxID=2788943 RepID=UPI0018A89DA0|nr:PQQ-binding-like beta-propeller repeat protein [Aliikangiella sp. G2MR2-5]
MDKIYIGMSGHVVCLQQADGVELWRTKLKSSQLTNIVLEDDKLYATAGGHLFCLNPDNGEKLWENKLPGLGYGACIIATPNQAASVTAGVQAQQAAAAAGAVVATTSSTTAN